MDQVRVNVSNIDWKKVRRFVWTLNKLTHILETAHGRENVDGLAAELEHIVDFLTNIQEQAAETLGRITIFGDEEA